MFLPVTIKVPEPVLTEPVLHLFSRQQIKSDKIKLQNIQQIIKESIVELTARQTVQAKSTKKTSADEANAAASTEPQDTSNYIALLIAKLSELTVNDTDTQKSFFFNKELAAIVPAGSFTPAKRIVIHIDEKEKIETNFWYAFVGPATTDNFGNLLSSTISYAPAILTLSTSDNEAVVNAYTNNMSDYETVTTFSY